MTLEPAPPTRRRHRHRHRTLIAACIVAALAVAGIATSLLLDRSTATRAADPTPSPSTTATTPPTTVDDVTWRDVGGLALPFSRLHGPRVSTGGAAAGYSRSPQGAAIAAVQVLARTSASAGPAVFDPILATQVTGANLPAMKLALADQYQQLRATAGSPDGQPIPGADAIVAGYVLAAYDATRGTATVDVVLTSPAIATAGQYVDFRVAVVWADDDWRVLAPPFGDWGTVATTLGGPPAGMLDYRDLGRLP